MGWGVPLYLFSLGVHPFLFLLKLFLTQNILHYPQIVENLTNHHYFRYN